MNILFLFLGFIIGSLIIYFWLKPKLKSFQTIDEDIISKNENMKIEFNELNRDYSILLAKRDEVVTNLATLKTQAEESTNDLYEKSYQLANEKMSQAAESMAQRYQKASQVAEEEYLNTLKDCANSFSAQIINKQNELAKIENQLQDLASKLTAAVEASKRSEEQRTQRDFYRLQLSNQDIEEISKLREVTPYLRDSEPLNKVIWKVYYEKPYSDLIGRVIGNGTHTGIYKITNIQNDMCYVGQAANLSDRWKQHIKRGIGAETPTKNKLYPAMLEIGVENFTFEVVEECTRAQLNEREDYWQDYFHAKDFGYSIK